MGPSGRRRRRLLIILAVAGAVLLVLVGIGLYGLVRGPDSPNGAPGRPNDTSTPTAPTIPTIPPSATAPRPIQATADAEIFARLVAEALFGWDTASSYGPADYAQVIVDVGDPTGNETAGLASDVRGYLPTAEAWSQLRQFQTRQWLVIDAAGVPAAWADAVAHAEPGQLLPGTTAYTISGTRHRSGTWGTEPVNTSHPVAFTVFVTCAPSFDTCQLLRLSRLDNPLR